MKDEVVVIGAGGHAKVCVELLQAMGHRIAYCVGSADSSDHCVGVPVLKGDENLKKLRQAGYQRLFVAIGSNAIRVRLASLALEQGYQLVNAISPHASISPTARLGVGIAIMAGAVINAETRIADLAIINTGATIDHDCEIRTGVHIAPQCCLAGNVVVGRMSLLGIGCKVIPEIKIGDEVTVGAGGVVVASLPNRTTAVGVPVRIIKQLPDV
ncbi:NeuD/PglB/VioB family sugar acetyltransferase [Microvirga tunisiensis]|uniref:Hexapeptide transferase n=1 Tax=Microvirga tunisiensis TaxID=2108360 RepID=A0A5N7MU09_9HYPH|nr:NeuD/PglB/VioB family sugar acetyltransferase [Microvirga tunisiensis]MPR11570.1 hexapeptide transferase [Microvirga tunisiensis]MPR29584.1 hexapeptide transferase [Microvirga tunisiensis]